MSLSNPYSTPFYTGTPVTSDARWDVAIGGHGYMIDAEEIGQFGRQSIGLIRQQADTADKPGEATLNPEGLWRRAIESAHLGAGQTWFDRPESTPYRFRTSKGIDPWTKYALQLLPDTSKVRTSAQTNLFLAVSDGRLYQSDGLNMYVTGVGDTTFAAATGMPFGQQVAAMTSSGSTVYVVFGAAGNLGVYQATGTAFSQYVTDGNYTLVRFVMGRLMVANSAGALLNITAGGASPTTALFTHPMGAAFVWTDMTEGQNFIYASGYSDDKSSIYRIGIGTDATSLDVPVVAAVLPDGEIAYSLQGYLGLLIIGTSKGVRMAVPNGDGSLTLGSLIPTASPVYCSEGQDRFVWYGLTNYDSTSTGLGRLDLQNFTANETPAYASDLMATTQGVVQSVVTYLGKRAFTVQGQGLYLEAATKVASGTLTTGRITFNLPDVKTAIDVQVRHDPLPAAAEVDLSISVDGGAATFLGRSELDGSSVSPDDAFSLNQTRGSWFELTVTLLGDLVLRRITMQVDPTAKRTSIFQVPLLLADTVELPGRVPLAVNVNDEFGYLIGLLQGRTVVAYQEANDSYRCVLDDYTWKPKRRGDNFWNGTFIARLKEI